jgi:hypothetical protein
MNTKGTSISCWFGAIAIKISCRFRFVWHQQPELLIEEKRITRAYMV